MSFAPADDPVLAIDRPTTRASTVVVQRVPADQVPRFLEYQRGLTTAAERFPGYRGTELYPAVDDGQEWVTVIHFNDQQTLQAWIDSPVRDEWVRKLRAEIGDFRLKTLPSGFGPWFAGFVTGPEGNPPPSWKIAMTVLLGLYPTVMLLSIFIGPIVNPLGMALALLISNIFSVSLTQWVVIPPLMHVLGPWLRANGSDDAVRSFGGLALIGLLLGGLAAAFRLITG